MSLIFVFDVILVCAKTNGHNNGHVGPENIVETFLAIEVIVVHPI